MTSSVNSLTSPQIQEECEKENYTGGKHNVYVICRMSVCCSITKGDQMKWMMFEVSSGLEGMDLHSSRICGQIEKED